MNLHIFDNAEQIAVAVGNMMIEQVNAKPDSVMGFATGASPVPTYQYLIKCFNEGKVSFKDMTTFNLDEYCDLPVEDKNSYFTFMHENLFNHIDVNEDNVNFLNGNAEDSEAECTRYDNLIDEKKIERTKAIILSMTQEDYSDVQSLEHAIYSALTEAVRSGISPTGKVGLSIAELHRKWLSYYWKTYTPQAHAGLAQMYVLDERFTAYYDKEESGCAAFLRDAILAYTNQ